jgi:hypothetical protein
MPSSPVLGARARIDQPPKLAPSYLSGQLLSQAGFFWALENGVPVSVERQGQTSRAADLLQHQKVPGRILLFPKAGVHQLRSGIIDRRQQDQLGSAPLQPVVVAAIDLQQHPGLRVALPLLVVSAGTPLPRTGQARLPPETPDRRARQADGILLSQDLGEVLVVEVPELTPGQSQKLVPGPLGYPPHTGTSPVAMGQPGGSSAPVAGHQPPLLPQGDPEQDGGLFPGDSPDLDLVQDLQSLLFFAGQSCLAADRVTSVSIG